MSRMWEIRTLVAVIFNLGRGTVLKSPVPKELRDLQGKNLLIQRRERSRGRNNGNREERPERREERPERRKRRRSSSSSSSSRSNSS